MSEEKSRLVSAQPGRPAVNSPRGNSEEAFWDYTQRVRDIIPLSFTEESMPDGRWQKVDYFQGRRIIGRDSSIDGGVYITAGYGEAIVVDSKKYSALEQEYQKFLERLLALSKQSGTRVNQLALTEAYEAAARLLPYNLSGVNNLLASMNIPEKADIPVKVSLDSFVENQVGVCRHQALLAGLFLEKLHDGGHIIGKPSVDRNWIPNKGGHAWVRYTNRAGDIFIIDPAQKFIGPLSAIDSGIQWFYKRPEDK